VRTYGLPPPGVGCDLRRPRSVHHGWRLGWQHPGPL